MDAEWLRELCLSFPGTTEQIQWSCDLLFKVGGRMYAVTPLEPAPVWLSCKFLRRSFERQPHRGRLERRHRVHSSAHLKQEVAAPLNLLGGSWKRQAQLAQPFRVHPPSLCQNAFRLNPFPWAIPLSRSLPSLFHPLAEVYKIHVPTEASVGNRVG